MTTSRDDLPAGLGPFGLSLPSEDDIDVFEELRQRDGAALTALSERLPGHNATLDTMEVLASAQVSQISASGTVKTGSGYLLGFVVIASTSGSFVAYDNTAGSGTIVYPNKGTVAVGDIILLPAGRPFSNGLHVVISGTLTLDAYFKGAV